MNSKLITQPGRFLPGFLSLPQWISFQIPPLTGPSFEILKHIRVEVHACNGILWHH